MKILIATGIFPPDIGGPATYCKTLSEELPLRGVSVKIITYGAGGDSDGVFRVSRSLLKGLRHFVYFWRTWKLAKDVDVVFAQDPISAGVPALLAAKLRGKKFLIKIVGDYAWEQGVQRFGVEDLIDDFQVKKYGVVVEALRGAQRFVAKSSDKVIVPSFYLKKIVAGWGVSDSKISVVYNAVEPLAQEVDKKEARKQLGLDGKILVSVGRLVPWKGFEGLIKVVSELKGKLAGLKLVIIGSGPDEEKLRKKADELGVDALFAGALPKKEVIKYLVASDVFVLNTAYEGFSHQIIEAMGLGLPVVVTDAGGNLEISDVKEEAFLATKFNDLKALGLNIQKVLDRKDSDLSALRNKETVKKFSKENMLSGLMGVLKSL